MPYIAFCPPGMKLHHGQEKNAGRGANAQKNRRSDWVCACWVRIATISCWLMFTYGYGFKFSDTHKWRVHEIVQSKERISYFSYCSKLSTFGQSKIGSIYWRAHIQIFKVLKRWQINFHPTGCAYVFHTKQCAYREHRVHCEYVNIPGNQGIQKKSRPLWVCYLHSKHWVLIWCLFWCLVFIWCLWEQKQSFEKVREMHDICR